MEDKSSDSLVFYLHFMAMTNLFERHNFFKFNFLKILLIFREKGREG